MSEEQSIFISHATEDHKLASTWQELLQTVSNGMQIPWYSGDKNVEGGIGMEEWRSKINQILSNSKHILVLLTPGSNERPWVLFESGIAYGQNKNIVPVVHFMDKSEVHDIFKEFQVYDGRNKDDVYKQDHFHNMQEAKKIEGVWAAKWIEIDPQGKEIPFEEDALYVWSTEARIRMVGITTKKGIKEVMPGESGFYPMEGVVSGDRKLKRKGGTGNKYEGYWQGFTNHDIDDDLQFTKGRVELVRIGDKIIPPTEVKQALEKMKKTNN